MNDWLIYLLKVSAFQAAFLLFYLVMLRNLTFYGLNRIYLLTALLAAFVLPLIRFTLPTPTPLSSEIIEMIGTRIKSGQQVLQLAPSAVVPVDWSVLLFLIYASGALLLFQRAIKNLLKIKGLSKVLPTVGRIRNVRVFRTPYSQPFSFFNAVFVPGDLEDPKAEEMITAHELQHARMGHSYDRVLVDFIVVVFWFNPFIYLLRRSLIEIHEYQVDAAVIECKGDHISYQQTLVRLASSGFSGPVSFFNFSTIKQRIQMMNRNQSNRILLLRFLFLAPVLSGLLFLFSFESPVIVSDPLPMKMPASITQSNQEEEKPSILPLILPADQVEVSSPFGQRYNPLEKKKQFHRGMDFRAPIGTSVIATADGVVLEALEDANNPWGIFIEIQHGELYKSRVAHLSEVGVKVGDRVQKGQEIGKTGNSGKSTAPHLHYEVFKANQPVDPVAYIQDFSFAKIPKPKEPTPPSQPTPSTRPPKPDLGVKTEREAVLNQGASVMHQEEALLLSKEVALQLKDATEMQQRETLLQQEALERQQESEMRQQEALEIQRESEILQQEAIEIQRESEMLQRESQEMQRKALELQREAQLQQLKATEKEQQLNAEVKAKAKNKQKKKSKQKDKDK